jgi:hypothetical protein
MLRQKNERPPPRPKVRAAQLSPAARAPFPYSPQSYSSRQWSAWLTALS